MVAKYMSEVNEVRKWMKKHRSTKIFNWSLSLTNRCQAGVSGDKCDQSPTWVLRMKKRRLTTMDDDGYVEMARKRLMAVLAKFVRDEKNEGIEDKEAVEREEKLQYWGGKSAALKWKKCEFSSRKILMLSANFGFSRLSRSNSCFLCLLLTIFAKLNDFGKAQV